MDLHFPRLPVVSRIKVAGPLGDGDDQKSSKPFILNNKL